jgi:hypothetical protein
MDGLLIFDVRTRAASSKPCMNVGDGWIDVLVFKFENERRDGWVHAWGLRWHVRGLELGRISFRTSRAHATL